MTRLIWRRWNGRRPTGIDRVCLAYLDHFGDRGLAVVQHKYMRRVLPRKQSQSLFRLLAGQPNDFRAKLLVAGLKNVGRKEESVKGSFYLNLGHTGLNSSGFKKWVKTSGVRPIYFVHDLIPITHPQYCREGEAEKHRERIRNVLETASGIIGNSRYTLDELASFARREGISMPPTLVAWLGCDRLPNTAPTPAAGRPTFVMLGTIEARKNHKMILDLWSTMIDRLGSSAPRLLIIGQRGWEAAPAFELLDRNKSLRSHVQELNACSDAEIASHLIGARALLFPSAVEGFGLPLVEAFSLGVPVIASDLPVFREIADQVPTYLGATEPERWEQTILEYAADDSAARVAQLQRMQGFEAPSWQSHFERVEAWLETLS